MLCYFSGKHIHRRLYRPKGSTDPDSASGLYAVSLQQWPQAEGIGLLQEGDSPGTRHKLQTTTTFFFFYGKVLRKN